MDEPVSHPGVDAGAGPDDALLCECEMVSQSALQGIVATLRSEGGDGVLADLAMRSRLGKGPARAPSAPCESCTPLRAGGAHGRGGPREQREFFCERGGASIRCCGRAARAGRAGRGIHCGLHGTSCPRRRRATMSETYDVASSARARGHERGCIRRQPGLRVVQVGNAARSCSRVACSTCWGSTDRRGAHVERPWAGLTVLAGTCSATRMRARGRADARRLCRADTALDETGSPTRRPASVTTRCSPALVR